MRIAELAALAGVTVRTIRHYHHVGALPEPPRSSNGYRDYSADHLVAVLRIRELASSGLSLSQAGSVAADSASASTEDAMDEVDQALETQIIALTKQRERLARARSGHHVGLSRLAAALSLKPTDIPAAILFAHLYRDTPTIDSLTDVLLKPSIRSALTSLQVKFDAIDHHTTDEELEDLAAWARSILSDYVNETAHLDDIPSLTQEQSQLFLDLMERDLNDRQKEFLRRRM